MKLTVITPTYNRAHALPRLYDSIRKQIKHLGIHWVISDDGSTDSTRSWVESLPQTENLTITYVYQENRGKHYAIWACLKEVDTEYCFIMDSDDWFPIGAIDAFHRWMLWLDKHPHVAGVVGLCEDPYGKLIGTPFPEDGLIATYQEIYKRFRIKGDKKHLLRTRILKRVIDVPAFPYSTRVPPSLLWRRIGRIAPMKHVNEVFVIAEYQQDGITSNQLKLRVIGAEASALYYEESLALDKLDSLTKLRNAINYERFRLHAGKARTIKLANLWVLAFVVGYILHWRDRILLLWK